MKEQIKQREETMIIHLGFLSEFRAETHVHNMFIIQG